MDRIDAMRVFVTALDAGSLAGAGRRLGRSPAAVTRAIRTAVPAARFGYRFQVVRSADGKSWYATAEPAQYGRSGRLSFFLDASGVRSGDAGGKPLIVKN